LLSLCCCCKELSSQMHWFVIIYF